MNDALDPTGWAKATEATANASKEAIQASRDLGHFLSGPAGELLGMALQYLQVVKFERGVRLTERLRHFLAERGMERFTRRIALNIGLPLLENAILEEDDDLQDVWTRLLVNGGDADSGIELRRAFVSVLAEMSAFDVRNLAQIESASKLKGDSASKGVWTHRLPEGGIPVPLPLPGQDGYEGYLSPEVQVSLSNLSRLECIHSIARGLLLVDVTPFGRALIEACTR